MHEHGGRPGRRQSGRNLATDVPTLAHTHYNDTTLDRQNHLHRAGKGRTHSALEPQNSGGLNVESLTGQRNGALRGEAWMPHCVDSHAVIL